MRIALAQINYHIGNFDDNLSKMEAAVAKAIADKADLVVFAELAVCGYPPRDFLEFADFIERCQVSVKRLEALSTDIGIIVGSPSVNPKIEGKNLHNSAYFLSGGKTIGVAHKALLPNYDIFDEYRYFEPNTVFECIEFKGKKIALTVCEDLWDIDEDDKLYVISPMQELAKQQPDLMINIAASPFDYEHAAERERVLRKNASTYKLPLLYVNHVGAQTELIFDGGSVFVGADGEVNSRMKFFEEDFAVFDTEKVIDEDNSPPKVGGVPAGGGDTSLALEDNSIKLIHDALLLGIKDYFKKLGFTKAILGLSGGIDSAVTLVLAARALGADNVLSVMLPSEFSTGHSVSDSVELCQNLKSEVYNIPIEKPFNSFREVLAPYFQDLPFNVAEENMQARSRAVILMALSNKFGYILLNTSNKSEAAVGYGTLYGDMCGGISVLGDLYKGQVYDLARYINKDGEVIPENIITKAPSAELRPNQKDSDSLPDYDILDKVLYQYIEKRQGPRELIAMGFDEALVARVLKLVNMNEYKRHQTPPTLRVSAKAFGQGRRLPIVGKYLS
jgi:NAD+ synthase (glutamine-hydrolysing)